MALKAALHIETTLRNGKTILKNSFCDAPFKLADITEDKKKNELRLMLMSSSPGTLDEDEYDIGIHLAQGSSLRLQTQAYQRLFQMKKGAVQNTKVTLKKGSSFVYLPHPVVPHKEAVFTAKNKIHLAEDCSLVWVEVLSCGRKANDEVFQFTSYHSATEIFLNERLVVKENLCVQPKQMNVGGVGQMEGYTHQASLLYLNEKANIDEISKHLLSQLEAQENINFGVSALPVNGIVVRLLGHKAEQLFTSLLHVAACIERFTETTVLKEKVYV